MNDAAKKTAAPAKKAATPAPAPKPRKDVGFVIHTTKSRSTGRAVEVLNIAHADSTIEVPKSGHTFAARCVEHGKTTTTKTRREAHAAASRAVEWCATCKRDAAKKATA